MRLSSNGKRMSCLEGNWEDKLEWTNNEEIEIDMSKIVGRKDRKYDINWRKEEKNEIRMEQKEENWRKKKLNHKKCVKVPQK